jgi:hypothetical protein
VSLERRAEFWNAETAALGRRSFSALLAVLALGGPAACGLSQRGPSAVAQGRYFPTGNPNYDEFFVRLYRMQVELKAAPETLAAVRGDLVRRLALEPSADADALRAALKTKAGEVSGRGATLVVDPHRRRSSPPGDESGAELRERSELAEGGGGAVAKRAAGARPPFMVERARESDTTTRLVVVGAPAAEDKETIASFTTAVERVGEIRGHLGAWLKELEWLPKTAVALDASVEAAFVGESRGTRDEVHENLADAQKVVALMTARVKEIDENSAELEGIFVSAFGEKRRDPPPAPAEPTPSEPPPKTKPRPSARTEAPTPRPPADEAPAATAKPKQGTARPDFEP